MGSKTLPQQKPRGDLKCPISIFPMSKVCIMEFNKEKEFVRGISFGTTPSALWVPSAWKFYASEALALR